MVNLANFLSNKLPLNFLLFVINLSVSLIPEGVLLFILKHVVFQCFSELVLMENLFHSALLLPQSKLLFEFNISKRFSLISLCAYFGRRWLNFVRNERCPTNSWLSFDLVHRFPHIVFELHELLDWCGLNVELIIRKGPKGQRSMKRGCHEGTAIRRPFPIQRVIESVLFKRVN